MHNVCRDVQSLHCPVKCLELGDTIWKALSWSGVHLWLRKWIKFLRLQIRTPGDRYLKTSNPIQWYSDPFHSFYSIPSLTSELMIWSRNSQKSEVRTQVPMLDRNSWCPMSEPRTLDPRQVIFFRQAREMVVWWGCFASSTICNTMKYCDDQNIVMISEILWYRKCEERYEQNMTRWTQNCVAAAAPYQTLLRESFFQRVFFTLLYTLFFLLLGWKEKAKIFFFVR